MLTVRHRGTPTATTHRRTPSAEGTLLMHRAQNRHASLDVDITNALDRWVEVDRQRRQTVRQLQDVLTPAAAERQLGHMVSRHIAHATGIQAGLIHLEHAQQTHKIDEARKLFQMQPASPARWQHKTLEVARPPGAQFWWVRTDWMRTGHFRVDPLDDGLTVTGGLDGEPPRHWLESATPLRAEFEAASFFLVDPQRLGDSAKQPWVSTPPITIRGDLIANTTREFMPGARSTTECRLHLSHRLFQFDTSPDKLEPVVIGESHETIDILLENNTGRSRREPLPGSVDIPGISFHDLDMSRTLWARIDVRLDLQVEGGGNLLWLDPAIELMFDQWTVKTNI